MKLSIIIPCFNESNFIESVVQNINEQKHINKEIIVVNDGSDVTTFNILKELLVENKIDKLINHNTNKGKGEALKTGLENINGNIVIFQDADLEYNPNDYSKIINPIIANKADIVYGSRFLGSPEGQRVLYYWHRVANFLLTTLTNILININLTDMETGYKAFKSEVIKSIDLKESNFGIEPEITIKLALKNFRFYEVGISYNGRTYDEGKKIKLIDAFKAVYCIFKYRFF
jgi:glycosyltransferase involved in cell wall biosynthesis